MTQYVATGPAPVFSFSSPTTTSTVTFQLALTAVSKYIKITKIERAGQLYASTGLALAYTLTQYTGTTVSGGSGSVVPSPLRSWAAPANATCRYGRATDANNTSAGTQVITTTPITFTGGSSSVLRSEQGNFDGTTKISAMDDYTFAADYIIAPGTTLLVAGLATAGTYPTALFAGICAFNTLNIIFDEENLARST